MTYQSGGLYGLDPDQISIEQEKDTLIKAYEYFLLQISEEEKASEKRQKLSADTYNAIKRGDETIVDILKKRRGRKKFILIDSTAKDRLKKRDAKQLEKIKKLSLFTPEKERRKIEEEGVGKLVSQKEEQRLLEEVKK